MEDEGEEQGGLGLGRLKAEETTCAVQLRGVAIQEQRNTPVADDDEMAVAISNLAVLARAFLILFIGEVCPEIRHWGQLKRGAVGRET